MTAPSGNGHRKKIPPCVTGAKPHTFIQRQLTPGGDWGQVCASCSMTPLQVKLHAIDQLLTYMVAAVMMLLDDQDDKKPLMLNLLNAATYSGHIVPVEDKPDVT